MSKGLGDAERTILELIEAGPLTVRQVCEAVPGARATSAQRAFRTLYQKGLIHLRFRPVLTASALVEHPEKLEPAWQATRRPAPEPARKAALEPARKAAPMQAPVLFASPADALAARIAKEVERQKVLLLAAGRRTVT